jgi:hypothetical protein
MRVGLIFSAYQTKEYVERALQPWVYYRLGNLLTPGAHDLRICAVSVRFAGFDGEDDGTRDILRRARDEGEIDYLIEGPDNIPETTARSLGLAYLRDQNCDISIQWDADEIVTIEEIEKMLAFIEEEPFVAAFKFSYRNLVFTPKQWMAEIFTPMRVHRLKHGSYIADGFCYDNNVMYRGTITRDFRQDISFPIMTVPETLFAPLHYTWLSDTEESRGRSKRKVRYQESRNWPCSFSWDDSQGGLIFNPALPPPKVVREST